MANINKVGFNLGQKVANPFKTSRNSTTNPFKYSNFEGNTLQFEYAADVFEGSKHSAINSKLKMITSSVAGSMTKLRSSLTEPIVNFVNRVRDGISSAWEYAKNTNVSDLAGIKTINKVMNANILDIGKGIGNSISGMGKGMVEKMAFLNTDVTDIGKGLSTKWNSLISKVHTNKINNDTSVADLKAMWKAEIAAAEAKEVA